MTGQAPDVDAWFGEHGHDPTGLAGSGRGRANGQGRGGAAKGSPETRRAEAPLILSAAALMEKHMPPLRWALREVVPQGYCVFAGPPKLGKTWLCYQLAHAVASGGALFGQDAELAPVLMLALEDGERRAQDRLRKVLGGAPMPAGLQIAFDWPRLDGGGVEAIGDWAAGKPGGVVLIDTLAKVKPPAGRGSNAYDADNAVHGPLHRLCRDKRITVVSVTHLRKGGAGSDDFAEGVTGSMGITGTADTILVLRRKRGDADGFLHVTGRDVAEQELALRFDKEGGRWSCLGDAHQVRMSDNQRKVLHALRAGGAEGLTPNEVADRTRLNRGTVKSTLFRLAERGDAVNAGKGRYALPVR